MIALRNVSKSYVGQDILNDVSCAISPGERVGVVGPNGAGKSTLLGILTGDILPDSGTVELPRAVRCAYLRQQLQAGETDETLFDYAENAMPELRDVEREIAAIEKSFHARPSADPAAAADVQAAALERLGELQTRYEALGGYTIRHRTEATLCGLGFAVAELTKPFSRFSGGWKLRAQLARVLIADPDVLLLDEPSNYLDTPSIEWLRKYLRDFKGTLVLVSHDRYLLNSLTTVTFEIDGGMLTRYPGAYDAYVAERERRMEQLLAAKKNQDRQRRQLERFVERFKATSSKASQARSKMRQIERLDDIYVPRALRARGTMRIKPPPHCGQEVMRLDNVGQNYGEDRWVLRGIDLRIQRGDKIALIGFNGYGKSTLLRMMAGRLAPTEGRCVPGHGVVLGYQSQDFAETLPPSETVLGIIKGAGGDLTEQQARTLAGGFGFSGQGSLKRISVLSGGEKVRAAFARLLANPPNFLLLDEPTTHLDIWSREALELALADYVGTLCVVSHDIDFLRHVATSVLAIAPPGVRVYPGGYDYFIEKTEAESKQAEARFGAATANPAASGDDRKNLRRERAKARQAVAAERTDLRRQVFAQETAIETLEREQSELLERLNPNAPSADYAAINRRLSELHVDLRTATQRWETAATALEALEQELAALE